VAVELRHLRYFLAVAEELHFGRAARRLYLSQPSLSTQIRRLEDEIGTPLFERTTREVRLTEAGSVLLEHAGRVLIDVDEAVAAAQEAGAVLSGDLHLLSSHGAQHAAERLLARFRERHPRVRTQVLLGHDARLLEALSAGRAHGAFVWELDQDSALETLLVAEEPAGVVLPRSHPLADLDAVPRESLRTERVVLFDREAGPVIVRALERVIWGDDEPPEERILRVRDATAAQESLQDEVARGRGVAIVVERVFELGHPPDTVYRPFEPAFAGRLFFAWPPGPLPARDALLAELRKAAADRPIATTYRSNGRKVLSSVSREG
jgi:DNA-binding transcriptional LysR family regulator